MDKIRDLRVESLKESRFVRPARLRFKQNNVEKIWDVVSVHDSVYILIFNKTSQKLVLVKQFRPAVYFSQLKSENPDLVAVGSTVDNAALIPGSRGICLEVCAGIIDKNKPVVEIAKAEVLEECGFDAPLSAFEQVSKIISGIGTGGSIMTLFYVEVTEDMRVSSGGGLVEEGEMIQVVEMSIPEVREYISSKDLINCPPAFMYAIMWYLANKAPK